MTGQQMIHETLRQIWDGDDIPSPKQVLSRMTAEQAAIQLPTWPYSILTNLCHTVFWQRVWLNRLGGLRAESFIKDWRIPHPSEWQALRKEFFVGHEKAMAIAASTLLEHKMKTDDIALRQLSNIAVHNAYHLGQMNLMKRELRLEKTTSR